MSEDAHESVFTPVKEGNLTFSVRGGLEWMRFEPSGDIYVRGTKVDSDRKVYECFREWLTTAGVKL